MAAWNPAAEQWLELEQSAELIAEIKALHIKSAPPPEASGGGALFSRKGEGAKKAAPQGGTAEGQSLSTALVAL